MYIGGEKDTASIFLEEQKGWTCNRKTYHKELMKWEKKE